MEQILSFGNPRTEEGIDLSDLAAMRGFISESDHQALKDPDEAHVLIALRNGEPLPMDIFSSRPDLIIRY